VDTIPVLYVPLPTAEIRIAPLYTPAVLVRSVCTLLGRVLLASVVVVGVLGYLAICLGDALNESGS